MIFVVIFVSILFAYSIFLFWYQDKKKKQVVAPVEVTEEPPFVDKANQDGELNYFCVKDKGYHVSVWPKNQGLQGVDYLEFPIAGITHGEYIDDHIGEFVANMEPDPANPYDSKAIKILTKEGHRVGFVPRDQTDEVRRFATLPCICYCYIGVNGSTYFTDCYILRK